MAKTQSKAVYASIDDIPFPSFQSLLKTSMSSASYRLANKGEVYYDFTFDTRDLNGEDKPTYHVLVKYDSKDFDRQIYFSSVRHNEKDAEELWYTAIEKLRTCYGFFGE